MDVRALSTYTHAYTQQFTKKNLTSSMCIFAVLSCTLQVKICMWSANIHIFIHTYMAHKPNENLTSSMCIFAVLLCTERVKLLSVVFQHTYIHTYTQTVHKKEPYFRHVYIRCVVVHRACQALHVVCQHTYIHIHTHAYTQTINTHFKHMYVGSVVMHRSCQVLPVVCQHTYIHTHKQFTKKSLTSSMCMFAVLSCTERVKFCLWSASSSALRWRRRSSASFLSIVTCMF
jgi:hypothetical protein